MPVSPGDLGGLYFNICFPASKTLAPTEKEEGGSWPRHLERLLRVILERVGKAAVLFYGGQDVSVKEAIEKGMYMQRPLLQTYLPYRYSSPLQHIPIKGD